MKLKKKYKASMNKGVTPVEEVLEGQNVTAAEVLSEKADGDADVRESVKVEFMTENATFGKTVWAPMSHLLAHGIFTQDDTKEITFHAGTMLKGVYTVH